MHTAQKNHDDDAGAGVRGTQFIRTLSTNVGPDLGALAACVYVSPAPNVALGHATVTSAGILLIVALLCIGPTLLAGTTGTHLVLMDSSNALASPCLCVAATPTITCPDGQLNVVDGPDFVVAFVHAASLVVNATPVGAATHRIRRCCSATLFLPRVCLAETDATTWPAGHCNVCHADGSSVGSAGAWLVVYPGADIHAVVVVVVDGVVVDGTAAQDAAVATYLHVPGLNTLVDGVHKHSWPSGFAPVHD